MKEINSYKKYRLISGLTRKKASASLDISESYLEKIETDNREPGRETLIRMSKLYKCTLDELCSK